MGFDGVEIVMDIEDEFEIAIANEEASQTKTVGELVDLVFLRLRHNRDEPCPSQHGFYVIRRVLMDSLELQRSLIRPETRLDELIGREGRKEIWRGLLQRITGGEGQWPKLVRPVWLRVFVTGVLPASAFLVGVGLGTVSSAVVFALIVLFAFRLITAPFKTEFPKGFIQVKDLVKFVKTLNSEIWTRNAVFEKVRQIVVRELAVKESDVTLEANFVKDLGLS